LALFTRLYVVSFTPWLGETIPDLDFGKRLSGSQNELLSALLELLTCFYVLQPAASSLDRLSYRQTSTHCPQCCHLWGAVGTAERIPNCMDSSETSGQWL